MAKMSPRAQIRNELKRCLRNIDMAKHHLYQASTWCVVGKRPEIGEYVKQLSDAANLWQEAVAKFLKEL